MNKLKSTTLWLSWATMALIALIVFKDASWAVGIGMTLSVIPIAYVTGNKARDFIGVKNETSSQNKGTKKEED